MAHLLKGTAWRRNVGASHMIHMPTNCSNDFWAWTVGFLGFFVGFFPMNSRFKNAVLVSLEVVVKNAMLFDALEQRSLARWEWTWGSAYFSFRSPHRPLAPEPCYAIPVKERQGVIYGFFFNQVRTTNPNAKKWHVYKTFPVPCICYSSPLPNSNKMDEKGRRVHNLHILHY